VFEEKGVTIMVSAPEELEKHTQTLHNGRPLGVVFCEKMKNQVRSAVPTDPASSRKRSTSLESLGIALAFP
jgi:hypothetical protein